MHSSEPRKLRLIKTAWGQTGAGNRFANLGDFIRSAAAEGYDGVEFPLAYIALEEGQTETVQEELASLITSLGLDYIALIATRPQNWSDEAGHRQAFADQLSQAIMMGAKKAAVHAGSDGFTLSQATGFLRDCDLQARDLGLDACFETHRGRPLSDPFRTAAILDQLPDLRLTSDLSHWLVVIDRLPDDCMDLFLRASCQSRHLHARIGHEKGPQVPDPRDPLWSEHLSFFRQCWQASIEAAAHQGEIVTAAPEFGPPPYMNAAPYSQEPCADIADLNNWMRDTLDRWFNMENA